MSDPIQANEQFNDGDDLFVDYDDTKFKLAWGYTDGRMISINEADLDIGQAKALRDWLIGMIP